MHSTVNGSADHHGADKDRVGVVRGVVRRSDGSAVIDPTVTVVAPSGHQAGRSVGSSNGAFEVAVPADGHYVLVASAEGHEPAAVTVIVGSAPVDIEIVLGSMAALRGRVTDSASRLPVHGATVAVADADGQVSSSKETGADGTFEFGRLAAGTYTLVVTSVGRDPSAQSVRVGGDGPTEVDVVLRATAELTGTVTDGSLGVRGSRAPVPHSQVVLLDRQGEMIASTLTDGAGAYSFGNLQPADYTVIANGYAPVTTTIDVSGGRVVTHEFTLGARGQA